MKRRTYLTLLAPAALLGVACGSDSGKTGSSAASSAGGRSGVVTIANTQGQTWTCGFNPFNPAVNSVSFGPVYEPLVFVNALKNEEATPMLASDYTWSADSKTVTFTIRDGVKWSDGQPMTASDVLFTFNLLKKYPALDVNAIWSTGLQSVTSSGKDVVMAFSGPALTYFYYVAGQTPIVPEHVWTTGDPAKDPVQFQDAQPIGTGPFQVNPCNPNLITYTANAGYWQPGLPHLAKVLYPAYIDNDPANLDLANDKAQWGSQYIPGVDKFYTSKDPANHHTWFPPTVNVELFFNLKHEATGQLGVRQAFAYGIDRAAVSTVGEGGLQPAANQSGIVIPTYDDWYDKSTASQFTFDTAKAIAALATAGYSKDNPLKLDVITIEGYTDWDASLAEIKQELAPIGIELTINDLAQTTYNDQLYRGDFDVAYGSETGGPAPYYELRQILYGPNTAELGENAATNYERYSDPATDALIDQYASADLATQHEIVNKLQQVMLTVIPVVPTTESVDWYEYNTKNITGWPTPDDPYAQPAAYNVPDWGIVAAHLESK